MHGPMNIKFSFSALLYKSQQDADVTEFILSGNCSTCFGRHHHPSSGAQCFLSIKRMQFIVQFDCQSVPKFLHNLFVILTST